MAAATEPDIAARTALFQEIVGDNTFPYVSGLRFTARFETRTITRQDGVKTSEVITNHLATDATGADGKVTFQFTGPPSYYCKHQDDAASPLFEYSRGTSFRDMTLQDAPTPYMHVKHSYGIDRPAHHLPIETITSIGTSPRGDDSYCVLHGECGIYDNADAMTWPYMVFRPFTASGRVFNDFNGNGTFDAGFDAVLEDVQVAVFNEQNDRTDVEGRYFLDDLPPGNLPVLTSITLTDPDRWLFTAGQYLPARSGQDVTNADIGLFERGTIRGRTFEDVNGNGVRDVDEAALRSVVYLDVNDNGQFDRESDPFSCPIPEHQTPEFGYVGEPCRFTDVEGNYEFADLGPGRYQIRVSGPENRIYTQASNNRHEPPPGGCTVVGNGQAIQMLSGFTISEVNFGEFVPVDVFGRKFLDRDGDGVRDADEPGIAGNVELDLCSDGVVDLRLQTDVDGFYNFSGVGPGQHVVWLVPGESETQTFPAAGAGHLAHVTETRQGMGPRLFGVLPQGVIVNDDGNDPDADSQDTFCDINLQQDGLQCTFRAAIQFSNDRRGKQAITFDLPQDGTPSIDVSSPLPAITDPINIDGGSQHVVLLGNTTGDGLTVTGGNSIIRGLVLAGFPGTGIVLSSKGNNVLEDLTVIGSGGDGIRIEASSRSNYLRGNLIGLDKNFADRGNAGAGIVVTSDENIIGGYEADNGNLIAFNQRGVEFDQAPYNTLAGNTIFANLGEGVLLRRGSDDNTLQANQIGLDLDGRHRGNGNAGIWIAGSNNQVGGVRAGDGNTVAFNGPRTGADLGLNQHAGFGIVVALWPGDPPLNNAEIVGNAILGNGSYLNGGPGIDLGSDGWTGNDTGSIGVTPDADTGPNTLQNAPGLELVPAEQKILGRLYSRPETRYRIEFFASPLADALLRNEGQRFLGAIEVTTDVTGAASFVAPSLAFTNQEGVTATASPYRGDGLLAGTSEFSRLAEENPDSCARIDLQRLKQETWQAAVQRIEIITADDRAASQHLRALANKSLGPDRDGCIRASLDALNAFHGLLNAHSTLQSESGWWTDFQELLGNDLERLGTLDDGLWDEIVTLYDAAPSWDEAWDGIARVADDRDYRNQLIWELDTSVRTTFADWSQSLENGVVWLGRHGQEALFDGVVRLVDSITWDNLTEGLYAFADLFRKAFDPDVPVESRIGNFLAGYLTVTGVVEAGVTLGGAALTVARSRALVSRFGAQMIDDLNANILLQNRVSAQMASASQRAAGLRARGQVGVYRLRPGDAITDDLLWSTGYSAEQASRLREIARGRYTLRFRPTNPDSARWIRQGALPKPVTLKNKTVSELDLYLGFRSEDLGLVGLRGPADLINPLDLDACRQQRSGFCQQLIRRYEQRVAEFREISLPAEFRADAHGVVRHVDGRGVAGDIDPIDFFHPDGSRVVGADREALMAELREAGIQHSGEVYFKTDIITGMRQTCVTNPPKCVTEGSEEWLAKLNKVDEFMEGQRRAYFSREEIAIEFGVDGEMRAGVVNVLPDIIDGEGEGENSLGYDLPTRAQVEYLLGRLHIDIRRDQLTNIGAVTGAVRDQLFAQVDRFDELLRQELPDVGITFADFDHLSAAELVAIVNRETKGLHIDPAEPLSGEGEGDPLTVAQILDRIRAAVGEDQLADYQVETKSNGGFVVHSQAATLRPFDVNGDGAVAPLDVLLVINHLNRDGAGALSDWPTVDEWRRDVSGDSFISPLDALQVINFISRQSSAAAPAEGESASSANALFGSPLAAGFRTVQFGADQDDEHSNSPIAEPSLNWFSELGRLPSFTPRSPAWPGNSGEALAETLESGECGCEELIDVLMPAWPRSFRDDL